MRVQLVLPLIAAGALIVPTAALADGRHTVLPGESLSSIAAADHVSVHALAGANRLAADARLLIGAVLRIPPPGTGLHPAPAGRATPVRRAASTHRPRPRRTAPSRRYRVAPGDTLSGLAVRARVSVTRLAALNGLRPTALLITGTTIRLPGAAAPRHSSPPRTHDYVVVRGDTLSAIAARAGTTVNRVAVLNHLRPTALLITGVTVRLPGAPRRTAPAPVGEPYVVAPGDTLTALATQAHVSVSALAALNHLPADALLIAGSTIEVPASGASPGGPPYPTPERVTASQVEQIAADNGVPPTLAVAIAWEESGFNNDLVSNADARGVMQILPGTWAWIQSNLTPGTPLAPASAVENVRGGVLYLHALLAATDGNVRLAVAGYIQGLASVHDNGMYSVTRQYVSDVLALRQFFGGP